MPLINIIIFLIVLYIFWEVFRAIRRGLGNSVQRFQRRGMPDLPVNDKLSKSIHQLNTLMQHIQTLMQRTARMSDEQKKEIRVQIQDVYRNIANLLWKMDHVLALRASVKDPAHQFELMAMQRKLQAEVDRSLEVLESTSVELMKFDVMSGDRGASRLLNNLTETNQRLAGMGESYEEIQRIGRLSR